MKYAAIAATLIAGASAALNVNTSIATVVDTQTLTTTYCGPSGCSEKPTSIMTVVNTETLTTTYCGPSGCTENQGVKTVVDVETLTTTYCGPSGCTENQGVKTVVDVETLTTTYCGPAGCTEVPAVPASTAPVVSAPPAVSSPPVVSAPPVAPAPPAESEGVTTYTTINKIIYVTQVVSGSTKVVASTLAPSVVPVGNSTIGNHTIPPVAASGSNYKTSFALMGIAAGAVALLL